MALWELAAPRRRLSVRKGPRSVGNLAGPLARSDEGFSTVDPTDFSYPVEWLKTGPARERMQYGHLRNRMLKTGFENVTANGLKCAQEDYEAARKLCAQDPRLDYGLGLILWTHGRKDAAVDQFEAAARLKGSMPFVPAIQAAAWSSLVTGQDERGLKLLTTLATVISKPDSDHLGTSQRHDAALVLGRAFGYLEGPGRSDQHDPETQQAAAGAFAALPADLKKDFELGKAQVAVRQAEMKALAAQPADQLKAELAAARSQLQDELKARNQFYRNTSHEIAKTQAERRKAQAESAAKLNTIACQMENVQYRAALVGRVAANLSVPQTHVGIMDVGPTYATSYTTSSRSDKDSDERRSPITKTHVPMYQTYLRPENSCEQTARLNLFRQSLSQLQQIEMQVTKLRTDAQDIQAKRKALIEQNAQAAQVLKDELKDTRRSKLELSQQLQKLEESERSLIALKANADSLLAYVPWDVELNRVALTKSYSTSVK